MLECGLHFRICINPELDSTRVIAEDLEDSFMATVAKIFSLKVRAKRSSEHAFNMSGIIEELNPTLATLGKDVAVYDVRGILYPLLGQSEKDGAGNETGRLVYDSVKLRQTLLSQSFCVLSNEAMAAELDQLIVQRQNQFLARYKFIAQMEAFVLTSYPAKVTKLTRLLALVEQHFGEINAAYNATGPAGVTSPKTVMASRVAGIGSFQESTTSIKEGGNEKQVHSQTSRSAMTKFNADTKTWDEVKDPTAVALSQETISISENDELRHPNLENQMRHERVTVDLLDEIMAEQIFNLSVPNLPQIWANELRDFDFEIRKRQIQFTETFLTPRLGGRVSVVSKDAGENVRAGESVIRIENDAVILLQGQVKCVTPVSVGQQCNVQTSNVFESDPAVPLNLPGRIVSVRGYDSQRDRWNLVLECQNNGALHLPLGYDFEPDSNQTTITFQ